MTRFEKDLRGVLESDGIVILKERKEEIENLKKEGAGCTNSFRRLCIAQEVERRTSEYNTLAALI